jgi:hypothetical protein
MKLRVRYENEIQEIELDSEATRQMWVSLSLEGEGLSDEETESRIQEAFDEKFNRPEYNNWHKETRHIDPTPKRKRMDGKKGYIQADPDDSSFDIMDYLLCGTDDHTGIEYEEVCSWVRNALAKKPEWAEAFISVRIDGMSIRDYAAEVGDSENNITQKLNRAAKKLREIYKES